MDALEEPLIVAVERVGGGAIVQFADGRCVFFPAQLLSTMAEQGEHLDESAVAW